MGVPSALSRGQPDWDLRALFEELFMILQWLEQIMTSCGHHSLLLRDLIGTLKDLIMTLYRCHLCHLWGLPIGLPRYTDHDNLARSDSGWGLLSRWAEERGGERPSSHCVSGQRAAAHILFSDQVLHLSFNFPFLQVVWEILEVVKICHEQTWKYLYLRYKTCDHNLWFLQSTAWQNRFVLCVFCDRTAKQINNKCKCTQYVLFHCRILIWPLKPHLYVV